MRRPTLTLVKPSPIGVVTGPFSATFVRLTESSSSTGSAVPCRSKATHAGLLAVPVDRHAGHLRGCGATASVTSGPMPSPGMSVMVWSSWRGSTRAFPSSRGPGRRATATPMQRGREPVQPAERRRAARRRARSERPARRSLARRSAIAGSTTRPDDQAGREHRAHDRQARAEARAAAGRSASSISERRSQDAPAP